MHFGVYFLALDGIIVKVFTKTLQEGEEKLNMAKKLLIVWLSLTIVFFSPISIFADEDVRGNFFSKNVIINGEKIVNYNLQYSLFIFRDTLYIPLTPEMCEIYGVSAKMDWESHTLKLLKGDVTRKNISSDWMKNNHQAISVKVIPKAKVVAYAPGAASDIYNTVEIEPPELTVEKMDLKGMPLLSKGDFVYIPLRAFADTEIFNWDIHFDAYYGVCVSTQSNIPAKTYYDEKEAAENKGLVGYMRNYNSSIKPSYGQELLFYFKRAGEVYNVDPKLLIAIAHKESTFNAKSVSKSGAVGLMQVMPSTGARYGLTTEQLKDAKTSIDFGAMYISERITAYNGNWVNALSAYNQGSGSVNRGTHSTGYANSVIAAYNGIGNFLTMNGYVK